MISWLTTLALVTVMAAIPPLDESQQVRVETAADGTTTVDEAAFYALLENARDWPEGATAGAMVPDYRALRDDPDAHRGELFLLEGRVQSLLPETRWSREGWETVRGLVIRIDDKPDREEPTAEDLVIVHLVEPPELTRSVYGDVPVEFNRPVRLAARFHKEVEYPRRRGEGTAGYLNFVGRDVAWMGERPDAGAETVLTFVLLLGAFAGMIFIIWRIIVFNRTSSERQKTAAYLAEKRSRREQLNGDAAAEVEDEEPIDAEPLPDDPADALERLKRRHREEDLH